MLPDSASIEAQPDGPPALLGVFGPHAGTQARAGACGRAMGERPRREGSARECDTTERKERVGKHLHSRSRANENE